MSAVVLQIADAVAAALNAAGLTPSFTAERFYIPVYDLQRDLGALKVSVVPKSQAFAPVTRHSDDFPYEIYVIVQQKLPAGALTEAEKQAVCDPLVLLCEQIIDLFRGKPLAAVAGVQCMSGTHDVLFLHGDLDEKRVFTSALCFTFKLVRNRP